MSDDEDGALKRRKNDGKMVRFDGTISVGTLLTLGTIIFGGIWALSDNNARLAAMDGKVSDLKSSITDISRTVERQVTRLDGRIDSLEGSRK